MTALKKTQAGKCNTWLRRFNRKVTNPIMMTFAGRRFYTLVEHVGRHSKKIYQTPVLGKPSGEGFYDLPAIWRRYGLVPERAGGGRLHDPVEWEGL